MSMSSKSHNTSGDERPWQNAYYRYRDLEKKLIDADPAGWALKLLLYDSLRGRPNFDRRVQEYEGARRGTQGSRLPEPPASLLNELQTLADLRSSYNAELPEFVFEDAYHLAFHQLSVWRKYREAIRSDGSWFYRGQRSDQWDVGGSIYREPPAGAEGDLTLRGRAVSACRLGHAVAAKLGLSYTDAMAVVQHYSAAEILGAATWLVDFSWDPWVALFFASHGGLTGDVGIVWDIRPSEYSDITAGKDNPIGPLQLVVPSGIQRIDNQSGVFIIAGLPQIFDQYVAFGWETRFRQFEGLTFEDPVLGIDKDTIYPPNDPLPAVLRQVRLAVTDCGCGPNGRPCSIPATVFTNPFDVSTYERLLNSWMDEFQADHPGDREPMGVRAALIDLARFHARLQSPDYGTRLPNITSRSLNRLREAFDDLYFGAGDRQTVPVRGAIRHAYVERMMWDEEHQRILMEALDEIFPPTDTEHEP